MIWLGAPFYVFWMQFAIEETIFILFYFYVFLPTTNTVIDINFRLEEVTEDMNKNELSEVENSRDVNCVEPVANLSS